MPGVVTVTEGQSTSFTLGLASLSGGTAAGLISISGFDPMPGVDHPTVSPPDFDLTSGDPSTLVTVDSYSNPGVADESGSVDIHFVGRDDASVMYLNVVDKDALNFEASSWDIPLSASATTTFSVRLTQMPASEVHASLSFGSGYTVTGSPATLTFTSSDYADPHVVTVTAPDTYEPQVQITISDDATAIPSQRVVIEGDYTPAP